MAAILNRRCMGVSAGDALESRKIRLEAAPKMLAARFVLPERVLAELLDRQEISWPFEALRIIRPDALSGDPDAMMGIVGRWTTGTCHIRSR